MSVTMTVCFEEPFWVGVIERETAGRYSVCRVVFGAEPKDAELLVFLENHWRALRFSSPLKAKEPQERKINPKRLQRLVRKTTRPAGTGTRAQEAMKLQMQSDKVQRRRQSREQREAEEERKFTLRQDKRREKHRGH